MAKAQVTVASCSRRSLEIEEFKGKSLVTTAEDTAGSRTCQG
ncbi:MAG: hypothetical protein PVH59_04600 [Anaerolineae bacterium]|jgi:hypothetical protein